MKTIREWASELPEEFEVSILSQTSSPNKKLKKLRYAVACFQIWDQTVEGHKFWSRVDSDIYNGKNIKSYTNYLTNESNIEAIKALQGWQVGRVESQIAKNIEDDLMKAVEDFNLLEPSSNRYKLEPQDNSKLKELFNPQPHYDNSNGSLYKVATERGWNAYLFDIVKRLERSEKKGEFKTDLQKSIDVIKIWMDENRN